MSRIRYLCIPGLGQTGEIAWPQRKLPFDVVGIDPIEPVAGESLVDYSRRLARRMRSRGLFDDAGPTLIAGVSFGAAVAQEIAVVEPCAGVVLLSGMLDAQEIAAPLRFAARHAFRLPHAADALVDLGAAWVLRRVANVTRSDAERCAAMVRRMPLAWLAQQARMLAAWPGCRHDAPMLRIHGDADRVVPYRRARAVDVVIRGDRHMSSVARPNEVNDAILRFARKHVAAHDVNRRGAVHARS
ncbi:MAG TPA: alpha/beta hydrolase [Xanthomonadales bacterium]|nr:alpha/beta hydrolase [Xanthomonadales bacterium]